MSEVILIFHVLFAVALIGLVLIQKGKGAAMGAAFGSGASQTVFGSKGSGGFLLKLTVGVAALFFITSIALTYLAAQRVKQAVQPETKLDRIEKISNFTKHMKEQKTESAASSVDKAKAQGLKTLPASSKSNTKK